MAEKNKKSSNVLMRHRGRGAQVWIYLGKLLRMFVYQNDWKVLPMSALIAGLVGIVVRRRFFLNMEGTIMGAFAIVCVGIWNGCFNSIQVICRERDVVKREHRSGMHISSYIFSHMIYQAMICLAQTVVTLVVTERVGVRYPHDGLITPLFLVDFGISIFLITYASDMLSLWVSALARTTTTAMTVMPFVLIFQLVFSGGMLTLPDWSKPLTNYTISNPGLKVVAAQSDVNNLPYATIPDMVTKMRDNEIGTTFTVGQVLDYLQDKDNPVIQDIRSFDLGKVLTLGDVKKALDNSASFAALKEEKIIEEISVRDLVGMIKDAESLGLIQEVETGVPGVTLGTILTDIVQSQSAGAILDKNITNDTTLGDVLTAIDLDGFLEENADLEIDATITVGELVDKVVSNEDINALRDESVTLKTNLGKILDLVGEEKVKTFLGEKAAQANYKPDYENDPFIILAYWLHLVMFVFAFAALATITLEFIDKDKR